MKKHQSYSFSASHFLAMMTDWENETLNKQHYEDGTQRALQSFILETKLKASTDREYRNVKMLKAFTAGVRLASISKTKTPSGLDALWDIVFRPSFMDLSNSGKTTDTSV